MTNTTNTAEKQPYFTYPTEGIYSKKEKMAYFGCWWIEHVFGPRKSTGHFGKKKDALARTFQERLKQRDKLNITPVDTYTDLSREDFIKNYLLPGKPVLIKGAAKNWPAVGKWSHHFFAENYPEATQPFVSPESKGYGQEELNFKEIAKHIDNGSKSYVKFSNFLHKTPNAELDFDYSLLDKYKAVKHIPSSKQLFMGAKGTHSTIHAALANVFFVQIYGTKRWLLFPEELAPVINPQVDRQPHFLAQEELLYPNTPENEELFARFGFKEVIMEPGDFYFNPAFCWHYVENLSVSIGIGFRWIPFRAIWRSPLLASVILMAQYPSAFIRAFQNPRGIFFPKRWP